MGVRQLCAICARRDAVGYDRIDDNYYAVCSECRDRAVPEPPPEPTTRERVLAVLRRTDAMDIGELADALGDDTEHGRARISAALARAVHKGLVCFVGGRMDRLYKLAEAR
jgi:hypothetical protein